MIDEKRLMIEEQLKLETKISIQSSELAFFKANFNEECLRCDFLDDLKLEINILNQKNKQLIETNDLLLQKTKLSYKNNNNELQIPTSEWDNYDESIITDEATGKLLYLSNL